MTSNQHKKKLPTTPKETTAKMKIIFSCDSLMMWERKSSRDNNGNDDGKKHSSNWRKINWEKKEHQQFFAASVRRS